MIGPQQMPPGVWGEPMAGKIRKPAIVQAVLLVIASLTILAFASEKPVSRNPKAQALIDKVWADRQHDWNDKRLDREIADLEEADRLDPNNHSILSYISRCYFQRGMTEQEKGPGYRERARVYFDRGYEFAKKALSIKETSLGHYLAAINKGASVAGAGIVEQARSFREIKNHMDWIGQHDPGFHYGAYARFWLDCYQHAPDRLIAMAGISKEEACDRLDTAIRHEPNFLENHYYRLTSCIDPQDDKAYLSALDTALRIDPQSLPDEKSSNEYYHGVLLKMWKARTGKDHP